MQSKHAVYAYCALATRLRVSNVNIMQALTPFFADACRPLGGQLFDSEKFAQVVQEKFGLKIPRLAALGLAEQLAAEGILETVSKSPSSTVYRYAANPKSVNEASVPSLTEAQIDTVFNQFVTLCRADSRLVAVTDSSLHDAFLDRLLNVDSMRILSRREESIAIKKTSSTLLLNKGQEAKEFQDKIQLHLDFLVSRFLLDLRDNSPAGFERVSDIAFANMAAEAIACFQEVSSPTQSLDSLTVYLDSPLLLDMLGVNSDYREYGSELLAAIKESKARPAVFDHCVTEAESVVEAQLHHLRSGINQRSTAWGTSAAPDLLAALRGNVGDGAERLGIAVERDPDEDLHKRAPKAVGEIETDMNNRMQGWKNDDAKAYDRKSVWAMMSIRDSGTPCKRVCDSSWLLLTRNTPLVGMANRAWATWLKGSTKHSQSTIERWSPVAMSDKQFAGYLWSRSGGAKEQIGQARLLAHCSSAVRPRADVKAKAYNLVLELSGNDAAEQVAALLEDREGARALMRHTNGDPEDVTPERMPFILEQVKLAAGNFAADAERAKAELELKEVKKNHEADIRQVQQSAEQKQMGLDEQRQEAQRRLIQEQQDKAALESQNAALKRDIDKRIESERQRKASIFERGLRAGIREYRVCRWGAAIAFGLLSGLASTFADIAPAIPLLLTTTLGIVGFWFVPEYLNRPLQLIAMKRLNAVIATLDSGLEVPSIAPDFKKGQWVVVVDDLRLTLPDR